MKGGWILALLAATAATGCREPKTTAELVADLRSPDPKDRRNAADDLRADNSCLHPGGPPCFPPEAVPALLAAIQVETDPKALGAMLISLGKTGIPEGKPIIEARLTDPDKDMRRWAVRGLRYWIVRNGQYPPDKDFPPNFPYGQPGYPPLPPGDD